MTKAQLIPKQSTNLEVFDPEESAMRIHSLEAAEKIAEKIKDYGALEKAINDKLEEQAAFAENYSANYSPGKPNSDSTVRIKADEYCQQFGFTRRTISRWCKKLLDTEKKEKERQKRQEKVRSLIDMESGVHVSHNSGENEWYTPKEFIESARKAMKGIDLDPASSAVANKTVKAKTYFTQENDGLKHNWAGNVWLNPPYAQPLISYFSEKLINEIPNIKQAVVLVNNATETNWLQPLLETCGAVCFLKGRVKFIDKNGDPSGAPLQGQAIIYFGSRPQSFINEFIQYGVCFKSGL